MSIRRLVVPLTLAVFIAAGLTIVVRGQQQVPGGTDQQNATNVSRELDETGDLWFVELSSPPAVEGTSRAALRAEKAAFRKAATTAGIRFVERYAFDQLWNGLSIKIDRSALPALRLLDGVKAIYPVVAVDAPEPPTPDPTSDLYTALAMTGADRAQVSLGFTGQGVKVGIIDTGIDYDHPDLGGTGSDGGEFPTARVIAGYDFVGDAYDAGQGTPPVEDEDPDDCGGHGTHVAGIVGANGLAFKGVAPGVRFGAYRVFGCSGTTSSDIMIRAMERALADGMDVVNMSIGSAGQWPQYPTAVAATRLVNKGVVVVASIGNEGTRGTGWAGAPGVGRKVIGVASYDNTHVRLMYFTVGDRKFGYTIGSSAPLPPTSGSGALARTGTPTSATDACTVLAAGSLTGKVALIRRGGCSFYIKAMNAQQAGAVAVVLYNNALGFVTPSLAPDPASAPPVLIPVVAITAADGAFLNDALATGPVSIVWTNGQDSFLNTAGGYISSFSSYGLGPDLALKPNLAAPGGSITSTYPLERGGYAVLGGTSMASPHVAGSAALYLEAHPNTPSQAMGAILQNTALPKAWWGNPGLGLLDAVSRQGAGMVQIDKAIEAPVTITPGELALGEGAAGPREVTLTLENRSGADVLYDLSFTNGLSMTKGYTVSTSTSNANVAFAAPSVAVPAGGTATVLATITPATLPAKAYYGGYILFTPRSEGVVLRVPFAGFVGDYQGIVALAPTSYAFPWLAKVTGSSYVKQTDGASFSMSAGDIPYVLFHLDHQVRMLRMEVFDATSGKAWHRFVNDAYRGPNSAATSFFAAAWNGTTGVGKKSVTVPNGSYVIKVSVLKALGNEANPADWEVWTSPMFYISR